MSLYVCHQCQALYRDPHERCSFDGTPLAPELEDRLVGADLDARYELVERLSSGGMGVIYRARHNVLAHEYAIKILFGEYASNPTVVERFRREARAISQLRHEHIVSVTDFGQTRAGLVYLVMELVEGRTLQDAIFEEAPLPPARALAIARQVAAALGEAHRVGYVHRDVKPSNVMLSGSAGQEQVKLLDFGLVGIVEPSDERLTKLGLLLGTPRYMSPEQCLDSGVAETADLYSLGVVLFEMLTGQVPFDGTSTRDILMHHLESKPTPLPAMGGLETIVAQLLEKKPRDRPQSAAALIEALDAVLTSGAIAPPPSSTRTPVLRPQTGDLQLNHDETIIPPSFEATQAFAQSPPRSEISAVVQFEAPVEWSAEPPLSEVELTELEPSSPELDASNPLLEEPELPDPIRTRRASAVGPGGH